jgi:hypothetical protein
MLAPIMEETSADHDNHNYLWSIVASPCTEKIAFGKPAQ